MDTYENDKVKLGVMHDAITASMQKDINVTKNPVAFFSSPYSPVYRAWEFSMILINIFSAGFSVYESYEGQGTACLVIDLCCACIFVMGAIHRVATSKERLWAILSPLVILDLVTVIPILVAIVNVAETYGDTGTMDYVQLNFLRCIYVVLMWHVFRQQWPFSLISDFFYELCRAVYLLFCIVFCCAGLFDAVYNGTDDFDPPIQYWHAIYWATVTLSSVGYGDICPPTDLGKFVAILSICLAICVVPMEVGQLVSVLQSAPKYHSKVHDRQHVIVCGDLSFEKLVDFLLEFYHEDNNNSETKMLIVSEKEPPLLMERLLIEPFFSQRVSFFIGSCTDPTEMIEKCNIKNASAVFILASPTIDYDTDTDTLIKVCAIRKFNSAVPIYVSVAKQVTEKFLLGTKEVNIVHSLSRLNKLMLGYNTVCPGFTTLISNLMSTLRDADDPAEWKHNYLEGAGNEMYTFTLPSLFVGRTFAYVAYILYCENSILALGLVQTKQDKKPAYFVNPGHQYRMQGKECLFVLAQDKQTVKDVARHYRHKHRHLEHAEHSTNSSGVEYHQDTIESTEATPLLPSDHSSTKTPSTPTHNDSDGEDAVIGSPTMNAQHVPEWSEGPSGGLVGRVCSEAHQKVLQRILSSHCLADVHPDEIASSLLPSVQSKPEYEEAITQLFSDKKQLQVTHLKQHIVICARNFSCVPELVVAIRTLSNVVIVILCPEDPTDELSLVNNLDNLFIIKGTVFNPYDLSRVNIKEAASIILPAVDNISPKTADADVILGRQNIARVLRGQTTQPNIIFELKYKRDILYFCNSMLESTLPFHTHPMVAAGHLSSSEALHTLILKPFLQPHLFEFLTYLVPGANKTQESQSKAHIIPLPDDFVRALMSHEQKTFEDLFKYLVQYKSRTHHGVAPRCLIPVALYRAALSQDNQLPYVFTNPPKDTLLKVSDSIMVLSPVPRPSSSSAAGEPPVTAKPHESSSKDKAHPDSSSSTELPDEVEVVLGDDTKPKDSN